jgi:hypothetical protein
MPPNTNRRDSHLTVPGPAITVEGRHQTAPTCTDAVLDACTTLADRTGDPDVSISDVLAELESGGTGYLTNTVYKAIQRLTDDKEAGRFPTGLQRLDRHQLLVPTTPNPQP